MGRDGTKAKLPIAARPCAGLRGILPSDRAYGGCCARPRQWTFREAIPAAARARRAPHRCGLPARGSRHKRDDHWSIRNAVEWPCGQSRRLPIAARDIVSETEGRIEQRVLRIVRAHGEARYRRCPRRPKLPPRAIERHLCRGLPYCRRPCGSSNPRTA